MRYMRLAFLFAVVLMLAVFLSCVSFRKRDIESTLLSAFIETCKTAEVKFHGDLEIYVISPTSRLSPAGCPIASIKGWREGRMIKEKEVEVCECRQR